MNIHNALKTCIYDSSSGVFNALGVILNDKTNIELDCLKNDFTLKCDLVYVNFYIQTLYTLQRSLHALVNGDKTKFDKEQHSFTTNLDCAHEIIADKFEDLLLI